MWIEYHQELRDHLKVARLAETLKIPYTQALGIISCLWLWAASNAPDGQLKFLSDDELGHACRSERLFPGSALRYALVKSGLVDTGGMIHQWKKYGIKYLASARKRKERYEVKQRTFQERSKNVTTPVSGTSTVPTVPYRNTKEGTASADGALRAFFSHTTKALQNKSEVVDVRRAMSHLHRVCRPWIAKNPDRIGELTAEIDRLPPGLPVEGYVRAITGMMSRRQGEYHKTLGEQVGSLERLAEAGKQVASTT